MSLSVIPHGVYIPHSWYVHKDDAVAVQVVANAIDEETSQEVYDFLRPLKRGDELWFWEGTGSSSQKGYVIVRDGIQVDSLVTDSPQSTPSQEG